MTAEIMEELGVAVEVVEELHTIDHLIPAEGEHWIATPFIVRILDAQEPRIMEPHKCEAIEWFEIDKATIAAIYHDRAEFAGVRA